jgi:hypothetical protein
MRTRVKDPIERARLKAERAVEREVMRSPRREVDNAAIVIEVEGARMLVTIGPDDPIWESGGVESYRGAIVRFVPGDRTDEEIDRLQLRIAQVAAATRILPRRRAGVVTEQPREPRRSAHKRARELVGQMIEEANTQDRSALQAFCEEVMSRAGL